MTFVLIAIGAAVAVAVELLEAAAIVLAVAVTRGWRDAVTGAAAGVVACGLLAAALGPALSAIDLDTLRLVIGTLLLLLGLEWLRKATLRLGHRRARSSSMREYAETVAELEDASLRGSADVDWAARVTAFKGVLLEGVEIVLIVAVLAARPGGAAPALVGAGAAAVIVTAAVGLLRAPLARVPETELKWGVGVLLTSFGTFFAAEGMSVRWYGGDAALLYVIAVVGLASSVLSRQLARTAVAT